MLPLKHNQNKTDMYNLKFRVTREEMLYSLDESELRKEESAFCFYGTNSLKAWDD